jgi:carbon-monoxide dehydrogenase medium subunit
VSLLGGTMLARSARGSRTITAQRFLKAPFATDLAADEMLVEVRLPRIPSGRGYCFLEVSQRLGDRALIAAGCLLTIRYGVCRDVRISLPNAGDNLYRVAAAEAAIEGTPITPARLRALIREAEARKGVAR